MMQVNNCISKVAKLYKISNCYFSGSIKHFNMDDILKTKKVFIEGKETVVRVVKEATKSPLTDSDYFCPGSNEDVSKIVKAVSYTHLTLPTKA